MNQSEQWGKQFPAIWKASGQYHVPGNELNGTEIEHTARTIAIQSLLVSDTFVDSLDELLNHYAIRQEYAHQLGEWLANKFDENSYAYIHLGARTAHFVSSAFDGQELEHANMGDTVATYIDGVYDAAEGLDVRDIPANERYIAMRPAAYYKIVIEGDEFLHRDFNSDNGSRARANVEFVANLQVVKTNNLPQTDWTALGTTHPADVLYNYAVGGGATYVGAIWHKSAIGTVQLLDIQAEEEYSARHQGSLLLAKAALGQGYLRPEACATLGDSSGAFV